MSAPCPGVHYPGCGVALGCDPGPHSRHPLTASQFLDTLQHRMRFPIRALQVDGGWEFAAQFEQACQQRGLHLYVLHPAPPKLNGSVERAQRTHTEEFYQLTTYSLHMNNSTENCGSGNGSITPYVLTSRSAT